MTVTIDQILEETKKHKDIYRLQSLNRQIKECIKNQNSADERTIVSNLVNLQDKASKETLLTKSAAENNIAFAKALIQSRAQSDLQNRRGQTALFIAASMNHIELLYELIIATGGINKPDDIKRNTPLIEAVSNGHEDTALLLLEYGADFDPQNFNNESALLIASSKGQTKVVDALIKAGVDVHSNTYKKTPLSEALSNGHEETAELLIQAGAPINLHSTIFNDLIKTAPCRYEGIAKLLIDNINIGDFVKGASNPNLPFIRYLAKVVDLANNCGDTPPGDIELNKYQVAATTLDLSSPLNVAEKDTIDHIARPKISSPPIDAAKQNSQGLDNAIHEAFIANPLNPITEDLDGKNPSNNEAIACQRQNTTRPTSQASTNELSQSFTDQVTKQDAHDHDLEGMPVCVIS